MLTLENAVAFRRELIEQERNEKLTETPKLFRARRLRTLGRKPKVSDAEIILAVKQCNENATKAAELLNCSRHTINQRFKIIKLRASQC